MERVRTGRTIGFLVRRKSNGHLEGVINMSEPVMGVLQSAYLGFYAFAGFERQGNMTEGLSLILDHVSGLFKERWKRTFSLLISLSSVLIHRLSLCKKSVLPVTQSGVSEAATHRLAMLPRQFPGSRLFASGSAIGDNPNNARQQRCAARRSCRRRFLRPQSRARLSRPPVRCLTECAIGGRG